MSQRIALLFPGQGAQAIGMGNTLYQESPAAQAILKTFNETASPETQPNTLLNTMFEGPEETLKQTQYTQPAILSHSIAAFEAFKAAVDMKQFEVVAAAGHSLGEYGALYAAGVIEAETAASLIQKRASLMSQAANGAMSAIIGMDSETIRTVFEKEGFNANQVVIANDNAPDQVVISGTPEGVEAAGAALKNAGAKRVLPLPVSGAFHSPLMSPACEAFAQVLDTVDFAPANFLVVSNMDGEASINPITLKAKLSQQIDGSVCWTQTMRCLVEELKIDTVIEFGPGNVLTNLMKRAYPDVTRHNINTMQDLHFFMETLNTAPAMA